MKCPKCHALLNEVTRAGVLLDVCQRCLGMWLERGELDKIAARLRAVEEDRDDNERHDRSVEPRGRYDEERPSSAGRTLPCTSTPSGSSR